MSNDTQNIIDALLQFAAEQDRASCTAFALLLHAEKHQGKQVQAVVEALENVKMSTAFTTFRYLVKRGYLETKPDPRSITAPTYCTYLNRVRNSLR